MSMSGMDSGGEADEDNESESEVSGVSDQEDRLATAAQKKDTRASKKERQWSDQREPVMNMFVRLVD